VPLWKHTQERAKNTGQAEEEGKKRVRNNRGNTQGTRESPAAQGEDQARADGYS